MPKLTVTAEPGTNTITTICELNAPVKRVFRAYTDKDLIVQWWGPKAYETRIETFEPRSGGSWRMTHIDKAGNEYSFHGVIHEVLSGTRIIQTFEFDGLPESGHVMLETTTFEADGDITRVKTVSVFQSVEDRDGMVQSGMEAGQRESMERLQDLLAR